MPGLAHVPLPLGRSPEASSEASEPPSRGWGHTGASPSNPTPSPHPCPRGANPFPQSPATGAGVSILTLTLRQSCLPPPTGAGWEEAVPGALPSLGYTELHPAGPVGQAGPNHRGGPLWKHETQVRGRLQPPQTSSSSPLLAALNNSRPPSPPAFPSPFRYPLPPFPVRKWPGPAPRSPPSAAPLLALTWRRLRTSARAS